MGFGLEAPSGVYLAGLTFVARDIVQRLAGLRVGVVAIAIGAALSWWLSSPAIAVASGVTFLLSESCDFLVYTPLQARHFPFAVVGSGLVADVVDSVVFLTLAGIPLAVALPGQLVGKAWVVLLGGVAAGPAPVRPVQEPRLTSPPRTCGGYFTSHRQRPWGGAGGPAAARLRAASTEVSSPAFRRPVPTSTMVPTIERTIWWQNEDASISKQSREPPASDQPARRTRRTRGPGRPRTGWQNEEKSCSPSSASQAASIRRTSNARPTCQRGPGRERVGPLRAQQVVAVQAGESAAAGVEERGRPGRLPDHDIGGQHFVDRTLDPGQVGARAHVEAHHLSPRVHTGVGAAGAGELDRVAQDTLEGSAEDAGHRGRSPWRAKPWNGVPR